VTACKLYIKIKIRETTVEEQIQWILSYIHEGLADIWKENMLKDLEGRLLECKTAEEFLTDIKKEFEEGDEEGVKVTELKRFEQESKMIEKFV